MSAPRVVRDGKVAVLVSPGYGAGWSTWEGRYREEVLFCPAAVAWVEAGKIGGEAAIQEIMRHALPEGADFYVGGHSGLRIDWLPVGTAFRIDEYDGNESLVLSEQQEWSVA